MCASDATVLIAARSTCPAVDGACVPLLAVWCPGGGHCARRSGAAGARRGVLPQPAGGHRGDGAHAGGWAARPTIESVVPHFSVSATTFNLLLHVGRVEQCMLALIWGCRQSGSICEAGFARVVFASRNVGCMGLGSEWRLRCRGRVDTHDAAKGLRAGLWIELFAGTGQGQAGRAALLFRWAARAPRNDNIVERLNMVLQVEGVGLGACGSGPG